MLKRLKRLKRRLTIVFACALLSSIAAAQPVDLFDGFRPGWQRAWMVKPLAPRATEYAVVTDASGAALRATSNASAAALWRKLELDEPTELVLSWRWRVDRGLRGNQDERTKSGDDYAARILITFGPDVFSRHTRAVCYVWADGELTGSTFPNPRTDNIATIVLESGYGRPGVWIHETRDVIADYRAAFGEDPVEVGAIAVIVDTDDTQSAAISWFDDVRIRYES